MPFDKLVFAQLMDFHFLHIIRRCVARYPPCYPPKHSRIWTNICARLLRY